MTDIYPVSAETKERALIDEAGYDEMYKRSVEDNEAFWAEQARRKDAWAAAYRWTPHGMPVNLEPAGSRERR